MPAPDVGSVSAVAALNDPVRRALFDAVRRSREPVTREQAAAAVGISRKLAAFHLDKLVDVGLLTLDTARHAGHIRVGRRPKRYRPADVTVDISIPPRRPGLLAELLLGAVARAEPGERGVDAALRIGHERGRAAGEGARNRRPAGRLGAERALAFLRSVLERLGYEPVQCGTGPVRFRTCPFHPFSVAEPEVVCGIHHAYVTGVVDGLDLGTVESVLVPGAAGCCVELRGSSGRK